MVLDQNDMKTAAKTLLLVLLGSLFFSCKTRHDTLRTPDFIVF
jgi:hypothetical protein